MLYSLALLLPVVVGLFYNLLLFLFSKITVYYQRKKLSQFIIILGLYCKMTNKIIIIVESLQVNISCKDFKVKLPRKYLTRRSTDS